MNGSLVHLGTAKDLRNESAAEDQIEIGITIASIDYSWRLNFDTMDDRTASSEMPIELPLGAGLFSDGFVFLAADRISPKISYGVPDLEALGTRNLGIHGEWTPHFLSQHGAEPIKVFDCSHPEARSEQLTHQVEAWMGEISPGVQIHLDAHNELDLVGMTYSFVSRRDVSREYRPTNVGFGVTYSLPVVTAILAAKPGDLIILESPEAHLHPKGQTKLAELMARAARSGVQILVESHSDHILNGLRVCIHDGLLPASDAQVLYFRWDALSEQFGTTVKQLSIDTDGRISDWPEGFFDEFDKSLEALLRPR